ncbi:unnamed protein product [Owenia fusiformis]|uniref:AP-5 complex subunit mu-1 n=1 Tax=Owenia fusiformis TaxID=6347 RepID=A0A8J1ULP3_OWEFU|nr:unnamed protein product [Owenia fusiformis]
MSLRSVWIVSLPGRTIGKVLFSKYFGTVERRAKIFDGEFYTSIPDHNAFYEALTSELGVTLNPLNKGSTRDSCGNIGQKPVFELTLKNNKKLWPLLVVEQYGVLFCCLPLVEDGCGSKPPLVKITGLSVGFSLLLGMADCIGPLNQPLAETSVKLAELHGYLHQAAPFGTPTMISPHVVKGTLLSRSTTSQSGQKHPAWKPVSHRGKSQLYLAITEQIRAVQYDRQDTPDAYTLTGSAVCKAELDGLIQDVSVNLQQRKDGVPLDHLVVHPFVSISDSQSIYSTDSPPSSRRLRFTPPLEMFTLCHYTVTSLPHLPIKGFYQMKLKDKDSVELLIQLKLMDNIKASFEYCELQIPFFNRGPMVHCDSTPSCGTTLMSPDKTILVWNIGHKFPSKSNEASLKASVKFGQPNVQAIKEETFCTGQNSYAQIYFKLVDYTGSGVQIDPKSVQVSPQTKHKLTIVQELVAADYKIWNSHGDALSGFSPIQNSA